MFVFKKTWCALFSFYFRFEIRPFALLSPTICSSVASRCSFRELILTENFVELFPYNQQMPEPQKVFNWK